MFAWNMCTTLDLTERIPIERVVTIVFLLRRVENSIFLSAPRVSFLVA